MEWILLIYIVAVFLWRRYGGIFYNIVTVSSCYYDGDKVYCSFVWYGKDYNNGLFRWPYEEEVDEYTRFFIRGFDFETKLWVLEPVKNYEK